MQKSGLEEREREKKKHDAGGNKEQIPIGSGGTSNDDTVSDDEKQHQDDRTGQYHQKILGGAVDVEDDQPSRDEEEVENNEWDLDARGFCKSHIVVHSFCLNFVWACRNANGNVCCWHPYDHGSVIEPLSLHKKFRVPCWHQTSSENN